jgi:transcriptional antiterminator
MNIVKLKEFIELISEGDTGSPKQVAERLSISDRLVYYYVSVLKKEFKAPILYCRKRKTYYFTEKGVIDLNWRQNFMP